MKPTYDELFAMVQLLSKANYEYQQEIKRLLKRVEELEERLNLNSKNSSKPPSSDQKRNKRPSKGGAKPGHPGHYRSLLPESRIDRKIVSPCEACPSCGSTDLEVLKPWIFQQVELPEIHPIVTQIECVKVRCKACKKRSIAPIPEGYEGTGFGPRLSSMIGLLSSAFRLSKRPVQSLLQSVFSIDLSLGVIPRIESRLCEALEPQDQELQKALRSNDTAYVDETTFREMGKSCTVWTVNTSRMSMLRILPCRGIDSLNAIRPRGHPGITITDRYAVYKYPKHQYCLAHIKRDFERYAERNGPDGELGKRLLYELGEIFANAGAYKADGITIEEMRKAIGYRKRRMHRILEEVMAEGSDEFMKLAERFLNQYEKLFLFTRYPDIECTNNIAERALRHIVIWRKTSYGTQSVKGSQFLERSLSIWMTLKMQGRDALEFFTQAYQSRVDPALTPAIL
jgi:transposase